MKNLVLLILALASSAAWAQETRSAEPPSATTGVAEAAQPETPDKAQSAPQLDTSREANGNTGVVVPAAITGRAAYSPGSSPLGAPPTNYISGGLGTSVLYDDNSLNRSDLRLHQVQYEITPEFGFHRKGQRSDWNLTYQGGVLLSQEQTARDEVLHDLSTDLAFELSPHVSLNIRENFNHWNTPFGSSMGDPLNNPSQLNSFVVTPTATRTLFDLVGDLGWRFRPHTIVGASASISRLRFSNPTGDQSLLPVNGSEVSVYLGQQFSRRNSAGVSAHIRSLSTPDGSAERTRTGGVHFYDVFELSNDFSLTVHGGPEMRRTHQATPNAGPISTTSDVFFAGGASLSWHKPHLSIGLSYDDGIQDGGGIVHTVKLKSGAAGIRAKLSHSLEAAVSCSVGDNEVLDGTPGVNHFRTMTGTFMIERRLTSGIHFIARYEHIRQTHDNSQLLLRSIDRNRVYAGITYRFTRPIGSVASAH